MGNASLFGQTVHLLYSSARKMATASKSLNLFLLRDVPQRPLKCTGVSVRSLRPCTCACPIPCPSPITLRLLPPKLSFIFLTVITVPVPTTAFAWATEPPSLPAGLVVLGFEIYGSIKMLGPVSLNGSMYCADKSSRWISFTGPALPLHRQSSFGRSSLPKHPRLRHCGQCNEPGREVIRGENEVESQRDGKDRFRWSQATVIENYEASADGSVRGLVLSVSDAVVYADGRRVRHVQKARRWLDDYKAPGQCVAVKYKNVTENNKSENGSGNLDSMHVASHLFGLGTSPYEARSSSATLDAAIVELVVDQKNDESLAAMEPGSLLHVSQVLGRGFTSLFNSHIGIQSALEEGRPLLMIAVGSRGVAPVRAALNWTPVLAHASTHPCSVFYAMNGCSSLASAPYLVEWDAWREAGVRVHPIPVEGDYDFSSSSNLLSALENALFHEHHGLLGCLGKRQPGEAAVILSGVPRVVAAQLTRRLTQAGIQSEQLLVSDCEFP